MVRKAIGRNLLKKDGGHKIRVSVFPKRTSIRVEKKASDLMSFVKDNLRIIPVRHKCGFDMLFNVELSANKGVQNCLRISYTPPISPQSSSELCSHWVVIEQPRLFGNHRLLIHARFSGFV